MTNNKNIYRYGVERQVALIEYALNVVRDICHEHYRCSHCPIEKICSKYFDCDPEYWEFPGEEVSE